ncbi:MAG: alpha/beta fold hydrolase [Dehalococcoidia bacterium]
MGFATIEGRTIHYEYPQEAEAGYKKGHTVLMVHGAYDNHKVWASQHRHLELEHTPLSLDLPGHGDSEGPPINDAQGFRRFVKAFADVLGLAPFVFCGHSMGGSMALDYAVYHPSELKGLVLVGSSPDWDVSREAIDMWKNNPEKAREGNADLLFSKRTPKHIRERYTRQLRSAPADTCVADSEACNSYDLSKQIRQIEIPALVICGDEEEWINGSRAIHSRLRNSTLEIVPAAGHAILVEQPDQINDALVAYLSTLP